LKKINISETRPILSDEQRTSLHELIGLTAAIKYERYSVAKTFMKPGSKVPRHHHRYSEETYIITSGAALMKVDDQSFLLVPGDVILIMPGEIHQVSTNEKQELEFLAITIPPYSSDDFILDK
jgi:mannose-6-phosphate isomerase-like protein (cupin superfamily)